MTPRQHPSEAVLSEYASGALRWSFATVVSAHLGYCPHCRDEVARLEAAGFALLESLPPTAISEGRLANAMAALEGAHLSPGELAPDAERVEFGPERLALGLRVRRARGFAGDELLYLLRLPVGRQTAPHGHQGVEFTTVLEGAYSDDGEIFAPGDFCELDASADHQPQVVSDCDCLCMIASEKPMRMDTLQGRLIQAMTGV